MERQHETRILDKTLGECLDMTIGEIIALVEQARNKDNTNIATARVSEQLMDDAVPDLRTIISDTLKIIGVPVNLMGFHYLRCAISLVVEKPKIIHGVTKEVYPSVAKEYSTTSSNVERTIRHAIEVAWDRGDIDILYSYFGNTVSFSRAKPTNSEFIGIISDKIRLGLKK